MGIFHFIILSIAFAVLVQARESPTQAITDLASRRLHYHANSFAFELDQSLKTTSAYDLYEISDHYDGRIRIKGTSIVAIASGLNHYLKYYCNVDFHWSSNRLKELPAKLPLVGKSVKRGSNVKWRYYFNVVTFSYSHVFWDWARWEQELDWMALNGINLPLAFTGQEYIYQKMYRSFNLSDTDLADFFAGPAFLAWQRMGNIQGSWSLPLPQRWIDGQFELQKKIIRRMRDLGMTPVLPAFAGFVPNSITKAFPMINTTRTSNWGGFHDKFTRTTMVYPHDPAFLQIQKRFLEMQTQLLDGYTSHMYSADLFNELHPSSLDNIYLQSCTHGVWSSIKAGDEKGIWVMQGWLFHSATYWTNEKIEALLSGAPNEDMLILDLFSEVAPIWDKTNSYFGKPFIWNMLHNFGGNQGFYGTMQVISQAPLAALNATNLMVGMGLTMEGIGQNEIIYHLMLEMAWVNQPIDTKNWVQAFIRRRYGTVTPAISEAWEILRKSAYSNPEYEVVQAVGRSIGELRPWPMGMLNHTGDHPTKLFYDPRLLVRAWNHLSNSAFMYPSLLISKAFRYDLVDTTRQMFVNLMIPLYENLLSATGVDEISQAGGMFLDLLIDLDRILMTNENFLLSNWIRDAKNFALDESPCSNYTIYFEYIARNQITLWGPNGELSDYASKQWGGLVKTYYLPRWKLFIDYLIISAKQNVEFDGEAYLHQLRQQIELPWQTQVWGKNGEPWGTRGSTLLVLKEIRKKWLPVLKKTYQV